MNSARTLNPESSPPPDGRRVYRVSELTRLIRVALENEFGSVWVEGELSNVHVHSSGHVYFTLKDESAQIQAALFRGSRGAVRFELRDGLKVRAFGEITAYEARSQYQIIVKQVEEAGKGSLQEAFEKLKKKLAAEGLFDEARKKRLPMLPRRIGIVTSPTGAAIQDMLNILGRRFPNLYLLVAPVKVQGEGAAAEIAGALDLLNARGGLDVLIVGRGGGSLEDLWAFNEEVVARAIARSAIPVISAVGHETDFTICDFIADLRAPTPSAAAELVVRPKADFERMLDQWAGRMAGALRQRALKLKNRLLKVDQVLREPRNLARQYRQRIGALKTGLAREVRHLLQRRQQRLDELGLRFRKQALVWRDARRQDVRRLAASLKALSPDAVLERGFSITRRADGHILRDAAGVAAGEHISTKLHRGILESEVVKGGTHGGEKG
ncbi:MAG: exodeoxyribonuclease VII large subunit [Kiritimatiellae bacterium]|nr:exodeoxyribonuclease VII large subunit [Kiritimatiellia bacterium]